MITMNENTSVSSFIEPVIVGSSFIVLTSSFLFPYMYAIIWMISDKRLARKSFQRIMIGLGFVDLLQLILNGYVGSVYIITKSTPPFWVNKVLGGLLNTGFIVHTSLTSLLAFNRMVIMCLRQELRQSIFNRSKTDAMIIGCYVYGLCFFIAYLCPDVEILLHTDLYSWHYSNTYQSTLFCYIELVQDFTQIAIMIVFYTAVVIRMKMLVANMSSSAFTVGQRGTNVMNREIGVSIQAALISIVVIVGLIIWFTAPQLAADRWSYMTANAFWLATAGTNAWIYFAFNKRLRQHALYYVCPFWRKGAAPLDVDDSAFSSSTFVSQRHKRTIALMGYGAACMVGRPCNPPSRNSSAKVARKLMKK